MLSTILQSKYAIRSVDADTAGDLYVIDLSERPFNGISSLAVFLHDVICDADLTVTIKGNDAVDGTGTDYVVGTKTWTLGTVDGVIEIDSTMIGYATDNKNIKSLVVELSGGGTITSGRSVLLVDPLESNYGLVNPETAVA